MLQVEVLMRCHSQWRQLFYSESGSDSDFNSLSELESESDSGRGDWPSTEVCTRAKCTHATQQSSPPVLLSSTPAVGVRQAGSVAEVLRGQIWTSTPRLSDATQAPTCRGGWAASASEV